MKSGRPFKVGDNVTSRIRPHDRGVGLILSIEKDWFGKAALVRWKDSEQLCLCRDLRHLDPSRR